MSCCNNQTVQKQTNRQNFIPKLEDQPMKFKVLSMFGLKDYLIGKYVFSKDQPKYSIVKQQGKLEIYSPRKVIPPEQYKLEVDIIQNKDQNISIPYVKYSLKDRRSYKGTIVYSHGNSSDLSSSLMLMDRFSLQFPEVDYVVYDYTGYGRSSLTETNEDSICRDLEYLIRYFRLMPEELILWGFSLGTYPCCKVATKMNQKIKGLILQSPLASIYSLFTPQLQPTSNFNNDNFSLLQHINDIKTNYLLILHSKTDEIVPFNNAKILYQRYKIATSNPLCFLIEVDKLKHNQMHNLLFSKSNNDLKNIFRKHLNDMVYTEDLSKSILLKLEKDKYFNDPTILETKEVVQGIMSMTSIIKTEKNQQYQSLRKSNAGSIVRKSNIPQISEDQNFDIKEQQETLCYRKKDFSKTVLKEDIDKKLHFKYFDENKDEEIEQSTVKGEEEINYILD